jgi:formiminoglutamase
MSNTTISQSQKRFQESLGALFIKDSPPLQKKTYVFLKSSTDEGIIRNGGRNGAKYAPQSFLSVFKKMTQHPGLNESAFAEYEVSDQNLEEKDFSRAQTKESETIAKIIKVHPDSSLCHLGGGHDHIYPLLKALSSQHKKIVVLNIDAHADTRSDSISHSGTPFRQFADEYDGDFHIFQLGLHPYANSQSTLSPLTKGKMSVLWCKDLNKIEKWKTFFEEVKKSLDPEALFIFSLDADALRAAEAPGVSAVNGFGLSRETLMNIWKEYSLLNKQQKTIIGIYEMNPVHDDLGMVTMRTMASFLYETLSV